MADKYSLDDILAEIDSKRDFDVNIDKKTGGSNNNSTIDKNGTDSDINAESLARELFEKDESHGIKKRIEKETLLEHFDPEFSPSRKKQDFSVTQIINTHKSDGETPKSDLSVTRILDNGKKTSQHAPVIRTVKAIDKPSPAKPRTRAVPVKDLSKSVNNTAVSSSELNKPNNKASAFGNDFEFPKMEQTQVDIPIPILAPEADNLRKKRDAVILEQDLALEQPHDLIDNINPYDVMKKIEPIESETSDISALFAGDTQGIAGNELKELAAKSAEDSGKDLVTAEIGVKSYIPVHEKKRAEQNSAFEPAPVGNSTFKSKRSNTALLESLNNALKNKRQSDIEAQKTQLLPAGSGEKPKFPTNALNIDYKTQILKDTSSIAVISEDPLVAEKKIEDLASKRKRKIRDFVLEDIDDTELDPDYYDSEEEKDEFDNYDASGQIWGDLCESHRGLKIRFLLLLVIVSIVFLVSLLNDLGSDLSFNFFGFTVNFLDKKYDPSGFLYFNMIFGVIGCGLCSSVITGGLAKLFKGKADCDSICAVPAVVSVISVLPHLSNHDFILQGKAHISVAAALTALLFNTGGKLLMIIRAKRNFRFISGDNAKYCADIISDEMLSRSFTRGVLHDLPVLCAIRKTGFPTDFLKNTYCTDLADRICRLLTPLSLIFAVILAVAAFIMPNSVPEMQNNFYWALTVGTGVLTAFSSLSVMFVVNNPMLRVSNSLGKTNAVVLGYNAAVKYSEVNSILVDAPSLFPQGSVAFRNIKRCLPPGSPNNYEIVDAIITAASLAVKSNSILTYMFYDMIAGRSEYLYDVENCIYEVNMGILGWIGNKRVMLGNRDQMKHHGFKVPNIKKEREHCSENCEVVYLAVSGETVAMFFIELIPNSEIKRSLQEIDRQGIAIVIRTNDSLVTVNKLADVFEISPNALKILPFDLHQKFDESTKYAPRGDGGVACNGTFTSYAHALTASKKLVRDITLTSFTILSAALLAGLLGLLFALFVVPEMFSPVKIILYNLIWFGIMLLLQVFRRYD